MHCVVLFVIIVQRSIKDSDLVREYFFRGSKSRKFAKGNSAKFHKRPSSASMCTDEEWEMASFIEPPSTRKCCVVSERPIIRESCVGAFSVKYFPRFGCSAYYRQKSANIPVCLNVIRESDQAASQSNYMGLLAANHVRVIVWWDAVQERIR